MKVRRDKCYRCCDKNQCEQCGSRQDNTLVCDHCETETDVLYEYNDEYLCYDCLFDTIPTIERR